MSAHEWRVLDVEGQETGGGGNVLEFYAANGFNFATVNANDYGSQWLPIPTALAYVQPSGLDVMVAFR